MDSEDKFNRLRKERAARSRSEKVSEAWEILERNEGLSTKEKLEKLIKLTGTVKKAKPEKLSFEPHARTPLKIFENHFSLSARYGRIPLSSGPQTKGEILSLMSRDKAFKDLSLETALFLDLETTGLSGGAGVIPFLAGLGFYRDGQFHVVQFFLGELSDEEKLIEELGRFFTQMNFKSIVSFNGKGFDLPLLETRFILHRKIFPLSDLPHLDFLFSARSLWKHKHESCRLFHLAQQVLQAERAEDIPAAEIPYRYFQYLRTGDFSLIEPVLYHNQEDILSLLGVVIAAARIVSEGEEEFLKDFVDASDLFGAANLLEHSGDIEKSILFMERALEGNLSGDVALLAKKKLSYHFKKKQNWEKAVALWQEMTPMNQLFCFRELAMYHEHKEKNYEKARQLAEEGLALAMDVSSAYQEDFSHRLERLENKFKRQKSTTGERHRPGKKSQPL